MSFHPFEDLEPPTIVAPSTPPDMAGQFEITDFAADYNGTMSAQLSDWRHLLWSAERLNRCIAYGLSLSEFSPTTRKGVAKNRRYDTKLLFRRNLYIRKVQ